MLAGGRGRRFGADKRLVPVSGVPMVMATAFKLKAVVEDTLVVLGPDDEWLESRLNGAPISPASCPEADQGMGHTLAYGVAHRPDSDGWLIMPADMPFIQVTTIAQIVDAPPMCVMAAPVHHGKRGHPVWFHR